MKENNNHIDFESLTARYLAGSATADEVAMLEEWVKTDEEKRRLFFEIKKSWMVVSTVGQVYDKTRAWENISRETGIQEEKDNIRPLYSGISYKKVLKIAASVLLLIAGLYSVIYFTQLQEKTLVAGNEPLELELRDGTIITVNKHSSLTYPVRFRGGERRVTLEGEAFFDVARNLQNPFIVEAQDVEIMVLGTSFFISAIKNAPEVEVMVNSGKVALITPDNRQLALEAGRKGVYNREENQLIEDEIANPNYLSWKTRLIIFDNTRLAEVFEVLENTYGVHFRIADEGLQSCRLTATFDNKPLEDILTIIRETFEIRFTRSDGIINVYGESCQ
ncbi:MAG: FecR family protein [Bacteroidales bacterium]